jgi:hypothetical protein
MGEIRGARRMKVHWNFLQEWMVSFAALVGIMSGFFAFIPGVSLTFVRACAIFISCLAVSGVFAWYRTKVRQFPIEELNTSNTKVYCRLHCPAPPNLVDEANALAHEAFGRIGSITRDRYETWRLANPNILACLVDSEGELVGYFDILPLRSEFMERFIRGDVTESDIHHNDILPPKHARQCRRLYLAGIVVRDPHTFAARRHARHLLWALAKYLEHFYGASLERHIFALGSTPEGKHLLQRFNFRMVQGGSKRRDQQSLYVASLNDAEMLRQVDADIGNWSQACQLSWEKPAEAGARKSLSSAS